MSVLLMTIVALLFLGVVFGGGEDRSELPPFTKEEAESYWRKFDYWNKK
jgi:hypothetical protein